MTFRASSFDCSLVNYITKGVQLNSNIYNEKCRRGNIKLFSEIGGDMFHLRR